MMEPTSDLISCPLEIRREASQGFVLDSLAVVKLMSDSFSCQRSREPIPILLVILTSRFSAAQTYFPQRDQRGVDQGCHFDSNLGGSSDNPPFGKSSVIGMAILSLEKERTLEGMKTWLVVVAEVKEVVARLLLLVP